jgi:flagellar biosynthesis/type III secretory pathway ATPase
MHIPTPLSPLTTTGTIVSVHGTTILAKLPRASVGDLCWIENRHRGILYGQIISFQDTLFSLALFDNLDGVYPGMIVRTKGAQLEIPVSDALLGRTIDPLGVPIDALSDHIPSTSRRALFVEPPLSTSRPLIDSIHNRYSVNRRHLHHRARSANGNLRVRGSGQIYSPGHDRSPSYCGCHCCRVGRRT